MLQEAETQWRAENWILQFSGRDFNLIQIQSKATGSSHAFWLAVLCRVIKNKSTAFSKVISSGQEGANNCAASLLELKENYLKSVRLAVESLDSKDQVLATDMEMFLAG